MPTTSTFCTILHPPYTAWKQAVEECERLKETYGESGDDAVLTAFEEKKKEAEDARAKYEQVAQEQVEMEDKEGTVHTIIRADALIIADITDRCGSPEWGAEAGRVVFVNLYGASLPKGITFPEGVQKLGLNYTSLPENITFPDGVQELGLDGASLPKGITLPDGVQVLRLNRASLPDGITFPEGVQELWLNDTTLPEGITFPDGVQKLWLNGASLPENITFPEGVQKLWLEGATMTDAVRGYVHEYQKRNPKTQIFGL